MPAANTNLNGSAEALKPAKRKALVGPALGSAFDPYDRLFPSYGHGGVFDYGHTESRDLHEMLTRDGKARSIEQVLTLPLRGADHEISGQYKDFVKDNIPNLDLIIDQMTSACVYRKAFFEKVWKLDGGNVVYDKLAFRPAMSCAAWYDEESGDLKGFRQRTRIPMNKNHGKNMALARNQNRGFNRIKDEPGWSYIPIEKSFIYVHGLHRDPVRGISDMDVSYWAYETRKKVLFLWFQFLENTSLPKTVIYADDQDEANLLADTFSKTKASGVMGLRRAPDMPDPIQTVESGGQGAAQFQAAVQYLESMMTQSVLAGFMDLTSSAASGTGSYALSADQSEFFLTSRQAVADEMAQCINRNLIAPLITYNYGDVELPKIEIGPLSNRTTERALGLLQAIIAAPQVNVPMDFVGELVKYTASYLGLNEDQVVQQVDAYVNKRKTDDEASRVALLKVQQKAGAPDPAPTAGGGIANVQGVKRDAPGVSSDNAARSAAARNGRKLSAVNASIDDITTMDDAIQAAYDLVNLAESGYDPQDLLVR